MKTKLLTTKEAAARLGLSAKTIRNRAALGKLKAAGRTEGKFGTATLLFDPMELDRYVASCDRRRCR